MQFLNTSLCLELLSLYPHRTLQCILQRDPRFPRETFHVAWHKISIMFETGVMEDARRIIDDHIRSATICLVTIDISQWSLKPEALSRQWLGPNGDIWFCFFENEAEYQSIDDGHMEVFYSNVLQSKFMSLVGFASRANLSDAHPSHPAFPALSMPDKDIPFRLMKFIPDRAFYWDHEKDDMITLRLRDDFNQYPRFDTANWETIS